MEKMADMKYGTEKENLILYDYVKLGAGIVTFDLLRTKHTNVIPLDQLIAQSSTSKGAAFILYNVARLQSILNTFDEHVSSGLYNKLPALDQIDFTLLKEEVRPLRHGGQLATDSRYSFISRSNRRNGKCSSCSSMVSQMCWNALWPTWRMAASPSICCART